MKEIVGNAPNIYSSNFQVCFRDLGPAAATTGSTVDNEVKKGSFFVFQGKRRVVQKGNILYLLKKGFVLAPPVVL